MNKLQSLFRFILHFTLYSTLFIDTLKYYYLTAWYHIFFSEYAPLCKPSTSGKSQTVIPPPNRVVCFKDNSCSLILSFESSVLQVLELIPVPHEAGQGRGLRTNMSNHPACCWLDRKGFSSQMYEIELKHCQSATVIAQL